MRPSFPSVLTATLLIILLAQETLVASSYASLSAGYGWDGGDNSTLALSCDVNPTEVRSGDTFTINVTLCNPAPMPMTSVFLEVDFDPDVEPVEATMKPYEAWVWKFEEIGAGSCASFVMKVRVPKPKRSFTMSRIVSGEGYVSVSEDYSTREEPYEIVCDVSAWAGDVNKPVRNSTFVAVLGEPGTAVSVREIGSGNYSSQEEVRLDSRDKSIEVARNVSATYSPFYLSLGENRSANYTSAWFEMIDVQNWLSGNFTNKSQRNSSFLDRSSYIKLDENGTVLI